MRNLIDEIDRMQCNERSYVQIKGLHGGKK